MFLGTNNQSCSMRIAAAFIYSLCLLDVQLFSSQIDKNEMILI
jgi:hypothetical protein